MIVLAVLVAALAACSDHRSQQVPDALTCPALLFALVVSGWPALAGALLCMVLPLFMVHTGRMFGGDFKLLVALGALLGPAAGLGSELLGLSFFYALPRRIRRPAAPAIFAGVLVVVAFRGLYR